MRPFGAPYAPSERALPTTIGPYRVLRLLAQGSTSDILLAREHGPYAFTRLVALKVLLPQLRDDEAAARRFGDEASAYARLAHPAIVRVYRFVSEGGELVLALEFVEGLPLNALRAQLHDRGDRLSDDASLFIGHRVFGALAAAHAARDPLSGEFASIIHADVNPSNVVVPWDGYARVVDFGSAQIAGSPPAAATATLGERLYLTPEQARGEPLTARTDLYAASLMLWELLTNRRAFTRGRESNREVLQALAAPRLASLSMLRPDLPKALRDVLARGLDPDPDLRNVQAAEVCTVLRATADLGRGRRALCDAIGAVRLASFHVDPLVTTPSLPEYQPIREDAVLAETNVVHRTDRPVVFEDAGANRAPPQRRVSRARVAGAVAVLAAVAWCLGLVLLDATSGPSRSPGGVASSRRADGTATSGRAGPSTDDGQRPSVATGAGARGVARDREPPSGSGAEVAAPSGASGVIDAAPSGAGATAPLAPPPAPARAIDSPSSTAFVVVPAERGGHRVWIDGRLVGQSPGRFAVFCGDHSVQVGSHGRVQHARLDCGEETEFR